MWNMWGVYMVLVFFLLKRSLEMQNCAHLLLFLGLRWKSRVKKNCSINLALTEVREELLLEEFPSIPWLPAESRCFMPTRLTIVVSLKHSHAARRQLLEGNRRRTADTLKPSKPQFGQGRDVVVSQEQDVWVPQDVLSFSVWLVYDSLWYRQRTRMSQTCTKCNFSAELGLLI